MSTSSEAEQQRRALQVELAKLLAQWLASWRELPSSCSTASETLEILTYYIDKLIIYIYILWYNSRMCSLSEWELWFAWWSPDLPDVLESSVTCVSIRSTECQVRFPILWSHCHMSKSIRLRLLVDCFPENVYSSPFVIAFCSRKSNCMEVINELMTES